MNKVILMGRIASEIEKRETQSGHNVATFTLAVQRRMKKDTADFIRCVAWNNTADFICRYFGKGRMIALEGEIQTRSWEGTDGRKNFATEVLCNGVYFTGEKATEASAEYNEPYTPSFTDDDFTDVEDDDLPF